MAKGDKIEAGFQPLSKYRKGDVLANRDLWINQEVLLKEIQKIRLEIAKVAALVTRLHIEVSSINPPCRA